MQRAYENPFPKPCITNSSKHPKEKNGFYWCHRIPFRGRALEIY